MTEQRRVALGKLALAVAVVCIGFGLLQRPARGLEAACVGWLLRALGAEGVGPVVGSSIAVFPRNHAPFVAVVSASCSSIAAVLTIVCLGAIAPRQAGRRRLTATVAAIAVVVAGNIVRIAGSVAIGLVAGRSSLVLFHDWIGGLFTFLYILVGYTLMLILLLPRSRADVAPVHADAG
jgi:exosortase/archaeosortase family protein